MILHSEKSECYEFFGPSLWCLPEYTARIVIICGTTCLLSHKVFLDMVEVTQLVKALRIMDLQCQSLCSPQTAIIPPNKLI